MFFMEALLVPPIKFRAVTKGGDSTTMATLFVFCAVFLVFSLHVSPHLVFEDGYSVTTVFDGNELNVNPRSILPLSGSSDFIILDTSQSTFFTVTFPDWEIKRLTGNGFGFWDADLATAMFNKPKSFAVDVKGNIYVADQANLAIRKISKSGVTTIAGGSETPGQADGPGRNASFSTDFEIAFISKECALMICDHGHKLIRQIKLKSEDCARGSHLVSGMSTWAWVVAGVSCLVGLIVGFTVRPYLTSRIERRQPTWVQLVETSAHVLDEESSADVHDGDPTGSDDVHDRDPMGETVRDDDVEYMGVLTRAKKKALERRRS